MSWARNLIVVFKNLCELLESNSESRQHEGNRFSKILVQKFLYYFLCNIPTNVLFVVWSLFNVLFFRLLQCMMAFLLVMLALISNFFCLFYFLFLNLFDFIIWDSGLIFETFFLFIVVIFLWRFGEYFMKWRKIVIFLEQTIAFEIEMFFL